MLPFLVLKEKDAAGSVLLSLLFGERSGASSG